jgi:hypothetical protein
MSIEKPNVEYAAVLFSEYPLNTLGVALIGRQPLTFALGGRHLPPTGCVYSTLGA